MQVICFFCLWIILIVSYMAARLFFAPVHEDARSVLGFNLFMSSAVPLKGRGKGRGVGLAPLPLSVIIKTYREYPSKTVFSGDNKKSKRAI